MFQISIIIKKIKKYYFDFYTLLFLLEKINDEFMKNLQFFDEDKYEEKCRKFIDDIGYYESDATPPVTDIVKKTL